MPRGLGLMEAAALSAQTVHVAVAPRLRRLSWSTACMIGGIMLLGALLRFTTLGEQSLWYDEAVTHGIVAHGLGHVLSAVPRTESTPPLYYVLVWLWSRVFGLQEAGLRSFSALCGTVTIPVVWAIGRRILSERVGLTAALLTAVNPLMFWYSQEARSYALLALLSACSLLALVRASELPTSRRILSWSVVCVLGICTHYLAVLVVFPEAAWLWMSLRTDRASARAKFVLALAPIAATSIALIPLALNQSGRAGWIGTSGLADRLSLLAVEDVVGFGRPATSAFTVWCLAIVLLGALLPRGHREGSAGVALPLAVAGFGLLATLLIAVVGFDYFVTRNLLATWPAFALVVAAGFGAARSRRLGMAGLGVLVALSTLCVISIDTQPLLHRADWRGAARALGVSPGERAIVSYDVAGDSLRPYMTGLATYPSAGTRIQEVDVISLLGGWLATPPRRLTRAPGLPGFGAVERVRTETYLLVRYRARTPRLEFAGRLNELYPNLPRREVLLQRP